MNRELFVRVATTVLRRLGDPAAEVKAEAIAEQMDVFAAVIGDAPPSAAVPPPRDLPNTPFPSPNPGAVAPVPEPESYWAQHASSPPYPSDGRQVAQESPVDFDAIRSSYAGPPLVTLETTIPDNFGRPDPRARQAAPVRDLRQRPQTRMKVEDLSRLIQERTPLNLPFDVQMEDGGPPRRITFVRNVVSQHACDSVQLIYAPPNATLSAREATEVMAVLHVDDVPFDLPAILKTLAEQAAQSVRPRQIPMSAMPPTPSGPVKHAADSYVDPAMSMQTQAIFNSLG